MNAYGRGDDLFDRADTGASHVLTILQTRGKREKPGAPVRRHAARRSEPPKSEREALELATACEQRSGSRRARRSDRTTSRSPSARVDALSLVASTQQPRGAMGTNAQRPYSRCCYRPPAFRTGKPSTAEPQDKHRPVSRNHAPTHDDRAGPTTCHIGNCGVQLPVKWETIVSGNIDGRLESNEMRCRSGARVEDRWS
jgi:hypothetical protein